MKVLSNSTHTAPRWVVTVDELAKVFVAARPRLALYPAPRFPVVFSCSSNGVWPATRMGFMSPESRQYVDGQSNVLDAVVQQMMTMTDSWVGGRFSVTLDGARRCRDGEVIVHFELTV